MKTQFVEICNTCVHKHSLYGWTNCNVCTRLRKFGLDEYKPENNPTQTNEDKMKQIKDDSVAKLIRILDEHRREIDKSLLHDPYADNAIALYEKNTSTAYSLRTSAAVESGSFATVDAR